MINFGFVLEFSTTKITPKLPTVQFRKIQIHAVRQSISHLCGNNESVNMTSRMLKQYDNFKLLHKCSPSQRNVLLKSTNPALIHAICDCITNIIHQKIPITAKQKRALAKKKSVLRTLSNSRTKTLWNKNLLIQHSGGILKTILGTVLNVFASL